MQWVVAGTAAVFLHPVWVGVAGAEPAEQGASAGSGASLSRRHFLWLLLSAHSLLQRLASAARSVSIAMRLECGGGG